MWAFIVFINIATIFFLSLQKTLRFYHYGILEGFFSILSYPSFTYDDKRPSLCVYMNVSLERGYKLLCS